MYRDDTPGSECLRCFDPERVTELTRLATFQGAEFCADVSGGLRLAATPGYFLATLRVANPIGGTSMSTLSHSERGVSSVSR